MMKSLLLLLLAVVQFHSVAFAAPTKAAPTAMPAPSSSQPPLDLSLSDIYPGKAELLQIADDLTSDAEQLRDTEPYARSYQRFQRGLQVVKPAPASWSADERARVKMVPAPTQRAIHAVESSRKAEETRLDKITQDRVAEHERNVKQTLEEKKIEAQERRDAEAAAQRKAQVDALDRNTRALENGPYYSPYYFGPVVTFTPMPPGPPPPTVTLPPGPGIIPR